MPGVAGEVVAGVDLHPVPVRVPHVHVEGFGHPVPAGTPLDLGFGLERAQDVADAQHLVRLVGEEPQVVQARPLSPGERHVVHGLLAEHPGGVERLGVLDRLGQAEAERPVVLVSGAHVGDDDVEVVEPGGFGPAPQVVALLQALGEFGVEEELHREAERVLGPDRLPHARRHAGRDPRRPRAESGEERLGQVQVGRGPHPEGQPRGGRGGACGQDQVVMDELVVAAQVQRILRGGGNHEAEQVHPESPGRLKVGDDKLGVGGPDDVGRRGKLHDHAPNRGTRVSPSGMWTIRDSV